jgi:hypothetical protein
MMGLSPEVQQCNLLVFLLVPREAKRMIFDENQMGYNLRRVP